MRSATWSVLVLALVTAAGCTVRRPWQRADTALPTISAAPATPRPSETPPASPAAAAANAEPEPDEAEPPPDPATFCGQVKHIVDLIAEGDTAKLAEFVSDEGLLVVRRQRQWDRSGTEPDTSEWSADAVRLSLLLGEAKPTVWEEHVVEFQHKGLAGAEFTAIVQQFRQFVSLSRTCSYRDRYSLHTRDHWDSRFLGPAAEGILCSSTRWYACFTQEGDAWRLHTLEWVSK